MIDQFGREIEIGWRPDTREISVGTTRDRYSGYPSDNLKPATLAALFKLADDGDIYSQMELFEEMEEKDPHLSGELSKRKNAVNSLNFDIIPYGQGAKHPKFGKFKTVNEDKVVDFCRDVIFSLVDFEEGIFDLLDAIGKGFAISEIMWDVSTGQAWIVGLKWIHQKKITFVNSMVPKIMMDNNIVGEEIPPWKVVYHRYKARSGHDTRAGMLRVCAWMYLFKNHAIKDWVAFMEVFGDYSRLSGIR